MIGLPAGTQVSHSPLPLFVELPAEMRETLIIISRHQTIELILAPIA